MDWTWLDQRPLIVALAGSHGAGKSTFSHTHLADCGLLFVNADDIAKGLELGAYEVAEVADGIRRALVAKQESFIRIDIPETSRQRVSMHVTQGGHDVPDEQLDQRFARSEANLQRAIERLPMVIVFDNSDLGQPRRLEAVYADGVIIDE